MEEAIIERYKKMYGEDYRKILDAFQKPYIKSIRVNTLKIKPDVLIKRLEKKGYVFQKSKFNETSFKVIKEIHPFSSTIEYLMGYFFVQDDLSTIPVLELNPKEGQLILDMAASPGGKTTHMAELMKNKGCIVSLEIHSERMDALKYNMMRMGVKNVIALRMDAKRVSELKLEFDKVLLDAPCSGEGMIAKDKRRMNTISVNEYPDFNDRQIKLMDAAISVLKKGGLMVYSTCSMAPEENEVVIQHALGKGMKLIKQNNEGNNAFVEVLGYKFDETMKYAKRFVPHKHGMGFFVARMVKE